MVGVLPPCVCTLQCTAARRHCYGLCCLAREDTDSMLAAPSSPGAARAALAAWARDAQAALARFRGALRYGIYTEASRARGGLMGLTHIGVV